VVGKRGGNSALTNIGCHQICAMLRALASNQGFFDEHR